MRERKTNRLNGFDYSSPGAYFITITVKDRVEWFGLVRNGLMVLNADGLTAHRYLMGIPRHFRNCRIDDFTVMPDHVHGIIFIHGNRNKGNISVGDAYMRPLQSHDPTKMLLSKIIQQYKAAVSREINRVPGNVPFQWQRSYYDRIIRDQDEMVALRRYIRENPERLARRNGYELQDGLISPNRFL